MVSINVCERVPHKCAVFQINQEWSITIQTIAHIYSSHRLVVVGGGQPASCGTNTRCWNITNITLPRLLETKVGMINSTFTKHRYVWRTRKQVLDTERSKGTFWERYSHKLINQPLYISTSISLNQTSENIWSYTYKGFTSQKKSCQFWNLTIILDIYILLSFNWKTSCQILRDTLNGTVRY